MGDWEDWCPPLQWARCGGADSAAAAGTTEHPKAPCRGTEATRHLPPPTIIEARAGSAPKCQLANKMCRSCIFFGPIKLLCGGRDAQHPAALPHQRPAGPPPHLPGGKHGGRSDPALLPAPPNSGCGAQAPAPAWHTAPEPQVARRGVNPLRPVKVK